MVMNKSLQKHTVNQMLKRRGIDPAKIDLEARIDPTLHLDENIEELNRELSPGTEPKNGEEEKTMSDKDYKEMLRKEGGGSLVIETIPGNDGWTYQLEMRSCSKNNCTKCPHGPYVYRHKTESTNHKTEYVKKSDIPLEVKKQSNELETGGV